MSDPFKVPEPSWEATGKARVPIQAEVNSHWPLTQKPWYIYDANVEAGLRAAYAVDVPAIVKREVERFAGALMPLGSAQGERMEAYLAARFPEAAPESAEERVLASLAKAYPYLVKHADHIDGEFSNALAELRRMLAGKKPEAAKTVAAVLNERLEPGATEGHFLPRISDGLVPNPGHITPAERDFLREWAGLLAEEGAVGMTEHNDRVLLFRRETLRAAARRVTEEAK